MNATQFLNAVSNQVESWDIAQVQSLAQGAGYHFSAEDLETAADELWGNLSEDQLRDISGGGEKGNGNSGGNGNGYGPPTIDHSNLDGKKNGEVWSPPPGEVSGKSCFFIRG
jgi:hypothetical protein